MPKPLPKQSLPFPPRGPKPLSTTALLGFVMASLTACTGAELAVVGAASGAADATLGIFSRGELITALLGEADEVDQAVDQGIIDLGLVVISDESEGTIRTVKAEDDRGAILTVRRDQRTEQLARLTVDVGLAGHEPTAQLLAERIRARLE